MLTKLAARNVKRQLSSYLIYFITVAITVALIYAVNNVVFSKTMLVKSDSIEELKTGIMVFTFFLSAIIAFVLGYATSFMLKLRKREFGTYLTLGMTRKNILMIFIIETLIMFAVALVIGIAIGLVLYQGIMALLSSLMDIPINFSDYSLKGLLLTIGIVFVIFVLSSLAAAFYLKKVSVISLLHGNKKVDKNVKYPIIWFVVSILSLAGIIVCMVLCSKCINNIFTSNNAGMELFYYLMLIAVLIVFLHMGASKSIVSVLQKNKKFASKGTNTFTLRQLNGKLKTNSIMMGLLAFLISFAVIGSNVSFLEKTVAEESLNFYYPFDISATREIVNEDGFSFEEADPIIKSFVEIEREESFKIFESENNYLHSFTRYSGENYLSLKDTFIPLSEFNSLMNLIGKDLISLNDEFLIIDNYGKLNADFSSAKLKFGGKEYSYKTTISEGNYFDYTYLVAVVPDEAISDLTQTIIGKAYKLKTQKYDAESLIKALTYVVDREDYQMNKNDFKFKEAARNYSYASTSVFILGALYISLVFMFMAMALLALKTLSELEEDKKKYGILFRLGASEITIKKTLFSQIFSFFIIPFIFPLLLSIPTGLLCAQIIIGRGFAIQLANVATIAVTISVALTAIYFLYFTATYFIAKKNICRFKSYS